MFTQTFALMDAAFARAEKAYHTPPEDKPSGLKCQCCGEDIMQGNRYYDIGGDAYCEYCTIERQAVDE